MATLFDNIPYPDIAGYVPDEPPSLTGIDEIELDFETDGLEWHGKDRPIGVGVSLPDGTTRYLPWAHRGPGNLDEAAVRRWFEREVRGKHITNTSTKFDIHMAHSWGIDFEEQGNTVADVAHQAALLDDHRRSFSLAALCDYYLPDEEKVTSVGDVRLDPSRMAHYHPKIIAVRAEADVRQVQKLKKLFRPMLEAQDLLRVLQLEEDIIYPVCEMERNAAPIHMARLREYMVETEQEYNDIIANVAGQYGLAFNPDKAASWAKLFQCLDIPIKHFTENGAPSFTDAVLKVIDHPVVKAGRRAGKIATLRHKFLVAYSECIRSDELLRYNLQQLRGERGGTVSGRFSSWDKNIQQVMGVKKQIDAYGSDSWIVRRLFIPGSGYFLTADAAQIEYRLFAHYANSPRILAQYEKDPRLSFHKLVQEMLSTVKEIPYKRSKDINFAKVYGAGRAKIAEMMELPQVESDAFVDIYDDQFPEVPRLNRQASQIARQRGFVKTITGRRARFPRGERVHKALNAVIQGSAADIMKQKIVELHRERKNTGFKMRYTVHDEVDGDVPDMESARKVESILNAQSFELRVPILWEVEVGANWADAKPMKEDDHPTINDPSRGGRSR